jgi:acetyl-CoA carboxylase biotin carboxyl carrier protein
MNIKEVKDLIREILQSDISEFELEHTGTKIRLRRGNLVDPVSAFAGQLQPRPQQPAGPAGTELPQTAAMPAEESEESLHVITSPIVGTFYRAPAPNAEPFVKVGQGIEEGATLCIVEAMKLMNEIPSDMTGEIVRIFVENAQPVEYGQKLFAIRPAK